jgi:hypothetical protein
MDRERFGELIAHLAAINATYSRGRDAWTISVTRLIAIYKRCIKLAPGDLILIDDAIAEGVRKGWWDIDRSVEANGLLVLAERWQRAPPLPHPSHHPVLRE